MKRKTKCGKPHVDAADGPIWCNQCNGQHPLRKHKPCPEISNRKKLEKHSSMTLGTPFGLF